MATAFPLYILLIDDHAMLRSGLRMVLERGFIGARIEEAESLAGVARAQDDQPDLVLLDIEMPGLNGLDGLTVLKARWLGTPVVMLSSHVEPETVREALERGAAAYLTKAEPADKIIATLERVLRGESTVTPPQAMGNGDGAPYLTPRQCEVLALLTEGLSNKLIGRRLDLSENTVRGHVQAVLAFLQVVSRSEATYAARQRGLVR
jgi:DNA-binding NarL/FixJ family response regulator